MAVEIATSIKYNETQGHCEKPGLSGEKGCYQFLKATWKNYQKIFMGTTTLPITEANEDKVMVAMAKKLLDQGKTPADIALFHNSGHFGKCSSGINKWGVKYDSCAYVNSVVSKLK